MSFCRLLPSVHIFSHHALLVVYLVSTFHITLLQTQGSQAEMYIALFNWCWILQAELQTDNVMGEVAMANVVDNINIHDERLEVCQFSFKTFMSLFYLWNKCRSSRHYLETKLFCGICNTDKKRLKISRYSSTNGNSFCWSNQECGLFLHYIDDVFMIKQL